MEEGFLNFTCITIEELKRKNEIKDINEVIIRFLDGTATGEEKVFLFNWLKQSERTGMNFPKSVIYGF